MNSVTKIKNNPPWEDWEDHGGFDDVESLVGQKSTLHLAPFQERPWYYEKKHAQKHQPNPSLYSNS